MSSHMKRKGPKPKMVAGKKVIKEVKCPKAMKPFK